MIKKKILIFTSAVILLTSCADTFDSVKRGLTGQKAKSGDEFLVQKKDPLVLPPDFEELPTPEDRVIAEDELSNFERTLKTSASSEEDIQSDGSTEQSILRQIRKQ